MSRRFSGLILLALSLGAAVAAAESPPEETRASPRIEALSVGIQDGVVLVSFRLAGALDADLRAQIASGLETSFNYRVELLRRRRFWPDARLQDHQVTTSVKFDSLSRQYGLALRLDGEVERSSTTDKADEMERWLTEVHEIPLGPPAELSPPEDYSVRVKANFPLHFIFYFIPWNHDTPWARTSLPSASLTDHGPLP